MQLQRQKLTVPARPAPFRFDPKQTALLSVDWQRDFLQSGGFGEALGNDVSILRAAIEPGRSILRAARKAGIFIIHIREGHLPDLSDCPKNKLERWPEGKRIGDLGPMGRILIRGEYGHEIIDELAPIEGELVIDKPGKNAFLRTRLEQILRERGIESLIEIGITSDICGVTTFAYANDLGFDVLGVSDAMASYSPARHAAILDIITAQGGILGWIAESKDVLTVLESIIPPKVFTAGGRTFSQLLSETHEKQVASNPDRPTIRADFDRETGVNNDYYNQPYDIVVCLDAAIRAEGGMEDKIEWIGRVAENVTNFRVYESYLSKDAKKISEALGIPVEEILPVLLAELNAPEVDRLSKEIRNLPKDGRIDLTSLCTLLVEISRKITGNEDENSITKVVGNVYSNMGELQALLDQKTSAS